MSEEEWHKAYRRIAADFVGIEKTFERLKPTNYPKLKPLSFAVENLRNGLKMKGARYLIKRSGRTVHAYRVDLLEQVTRGNDGRVTHYVSANLFEVDAAGRDIKQIAYADSPHVARAEARWFHAHDKSTGQVLTEIPAQGFSESAIPAIIAWVNRFLGEQPR